MSRRYYVYALIDPRDESTFYIGKGVGRRVFDHEKQARKDGGAKAQRIKEIWLAGLEVKRVYLAWFDSEHTALKFEEAQIRSTSGLTNITHNDGRPYVDEWESGLVEIEEMMSRMMTIEKWAQTRITSDLQLRMAARCWADAFAFRRMCVAKIAQRHEKVSI